MKKEQKYTDNQMDEFLNTDNIDIMTMNSDEISFVDTGNRYHFGSRKDNKSRKLLHLHFTSAFSENIPFFEEKSLRGYDNISLISISRITMNTLKIISN